MYKGISNEFTINGMFIFWACGTVAGSSDSGAAAFLARDRVGFGASSFNDAAARVFEVFFFAATFFSTGFGSSSFEGFLARRPVFGFSSTTSEAESSFEVFRVRLVSSTWSAWRSQSWCVLLYRLYCSIRNSDQIIWSKWPSERRTTLYDVQYL